MFFSKNQLKIIFSNSHLCAINIYLNKLFLHIFLCKNQRVVFKFRASPTNRLNSYFNNFCIASPSQEWMKIIFKSPYTIPCFNNIQRFNLNITFHSFSPISRVKSPRNLSPTINRPLSPLRPPKIREFERREGSRNFEISLGECLGRLNNFLDLLGGTRRGNRETCANS